MSNRRRLALSALTTFSALLLCATVAGAAVPGAEIGTNVSSQMLTWAKVIIIPTAAIMAIPALFKRDVGHALVTFVLVLIVGTLAFDPNGVKRVVEEFAKKVAG
jgi:hypothetical protein